MQGPATHRDLALDQATRQDLVLDQAIHRGQVLDRAIRQDQVLDRGIRQDQVLGLVTHRDQELAQDRGQAQYKLPRLVDSFQNNNCHLYHTWFRLVGQSNQDTVQDQGLEEDQATHRGLVLGPAIHQDQALGRVTHQDREQAVRAQEAHNHQFQPCKSLRLAYSSGRLERRHLKNKNHLLT